MSSDRKFYVPKKPRECDFIESCTVSMLQNGGQEFFENFCLRNFGQCQAWQMRMGDSAYGYRKRMTAEAHETVKSRMPLE